MKALAIDIGGTTIKGALIKNNEIIKEACFKSFGKKGLKFILDALNSTINQLIERNIDFISISSAGNIDPYKGVCVYASPNLTGWTDFNIKEYIENKYSVRTYVNNDAVCALLAEICILNPEDKKKKIAMITIGTGIGVAISDNGKIDYGNNFDGGMYAHYSLNDEGIPCSCGKIGCAEKEISATGILYYAEKMGLKDLTVYELFNMYFKNEKSVQSLIDDYYKKFNLFIKYLKNEQNIDIFIIGGGVSQSNPNFFDKFDRENVDIRKAEFENRAGMMGAYVFGVNNGKVQ